MPVRVRHARYRSWPEWRRAVRPVAPPGTFCATCWGQRAVWEPFGRSYLPVVCQSCAGSGRAW